MLIEGPSDLTDLLPHLADPGMTTPVALLAYDVGDPSRASFWPFAEYSPEYQAARWAFDHKAALKLIDLPAAWRLAPALAPTTDAPTSEPAGNEPDERPPTSIIDAQIDAVARDPLGALALAAGYEDGESWWRDVIEENPHPEPVFDAIADAMAALRMGPDGKMAPCRDTREEQREAHMRLEIAAAAKDAAGPVAVICGAWHVPALREKRSAKSDRDLLKGASKTKIAATWAPWTSPHLSVATGYGAGVAAPAWCDHLWRTAPDRVVTSWMLRIATSLRSHGHAASTASLIEAQRLARALAALRQRPSPGFEDMRDAAIAVLCEGEWLRWEVIARELLVGTDVGTIPDDVPLAPLLEDLKRQQKATRLKPEALERELSLDLRSEAGLERSILLHRLSILDVPWGRLADAGKSRGTFREKWMLAWEPEYAVNLVEHLVFGPTIELASSSRLRSQLNAAAALPALADLTRNALTANLPDAAQTGIERLSARVAETSDCSELLGALPPLADVARYGDARGTDSHMLGRLLERIAIGAAIALPYAARGLDAATAAEFAGLVRAADAAIILNEPAPDTLVRWRESFEQLLADGQANQRIAGVVARLLYDADVLAPERAALLFGHRLSPAIAIADAAGFFEGFFEGGSERLIFDNGLRAVVDAWILSLDEDTFTEHLPLFRRIFARLDAQERRRLLEAATGSAASTGATGYIFHADAAEIWARHMPAILAILDADPPEANH